MLIEFRTENHRSIREEQILTMEMGRGGEPDDPRPRQVEGHSTKLLPAAALYGANASGKSNVLSALMFMRDAVVHSHRSWPPDEGVPRDPFAWGESSAPSLFDATFLIDGVRFRYGFVCDNERFLEEWLYAWPKGRKQTWLERDGPVFKFGELLHGENRKIEQVTRANSLFLSTAEQHEHKQLRPVFSWFKAMRAVNLLTRGAAHRVGARGMRFLAKMLWQLLEHPTSHLGGFTDPGKLESLLGLLRAADTGIIDIKLVEDPTATGLTPESKRQVLVRHASTSGEAWLPLDEESQGTLALFNRGWVLLSTLSQSSVLLVDELEASLHPHLSLRLLEMFNDPRTNPHNAQLIFSTHDTNLLGSVTGEAPLRRDQIWLTERDNDGATKLYPLTDFQPRKAENLERGYLLGRYGAIPFLGLMPEPTEPNDGE